MSTKGTIFLTKDNEHCYEETVECDGDCFRLYLEIDSENIKDFSYDRLDGLIVAIKGDSEIAKILRTVSSQYGETNGLASAAKDLLSLPRCYNWHKTAERIIEKLAVL